MNNTEIRRPVIGITMGDPAGNGPELCLGFQAIISATNDKIQNYLENVDKTFVYANPNKKHISIQEFERMEFEQLQGEE